MTLIVALSGFLLLLLAGSAIFVSLGLPAAVAIVSTTQSPATSIAELLMESVNNELLLAVPLYLLMGNVLGQTGIARHMITCIGTFVGHLPGGMALVTVVAAVFFAGVTGATAAEVAAIAGITVPAMVEAGYERRFALGLVAAASTLGIMIPPSVPMILYAYLTGESVGRLFVAGIVPGLFTGAVLMGYVVFVSLRKGYGRAPRATWNARFEALVQALPVLLLPVVIAAAIYGGWATPTEVGAVASVYAILIARFVYRSITARQLFDAALDAVRVTSMVLLIVAGSDIFGFYLTYLRMPQQAAMWLVDLGLSPLVFLMMVNVLLLVLGVPLEPPPIMFMTLPILIPIVHALGIDPIHFAIIMVMNLQLAQISPPVGSSLFVLAGVLKLPSAEIFRGVLPFFFILLGVLIVLTYFPQATMWVF